MTRIALAVLALLGTWPAAAEVTSSEQGFATRNVVIVAAPPGEVWAALLAPARYWNPAHSYSGAAANLTIEPRAGG